MEHSKFFPFYKMYADSGFLEEEWQQEREYSLMKSYYPETARRLQDMVEEECQLLDYEGSRIYDEYPDRMMMRRMCEEICGRLEDGMAAREDLSGGLGELVRVLLYQDIARRRCRRRRYRGY